MIDENLTWHSHIKLVETKIAKNIGIIAKLRHTLPCRLLLMLYNSLILPYLTYCSMIWANVKSTNKVKKVITLQKKCLRLVFNLPYLSHTTPWFKKYGLLTVIDIGKLQLLEFMFKYTHNLLPHTFDNYFDLNSNIHSHNTRQQKNYHSYPARTCIRQFNVVKSGPRLWNSLPADIKSSTSFCAFKRDVRMLLLSNYE
jgi:hypothetical protein